MLDIFQFFSFSFYLFRSLFVTCSLTHSLSISLSLSVILFFRLCFVSLSEIWVQLLIHYVYGIDDGAVATPSTTNTLHYIAMNARQMHRMPLFPSNISLRVSIFSLSLFLLITFTVRFVQLNCVSFSFDPFFAIPSVSPFHWNTNTHLQFVRINVSDTTHYRTNLKWMLFNQNSFDENIKTTRLIPIYFFYIYTFCMSCVYEYKTLSDAWST